MRRGRKMVYARTLLVAILVLGGGVAAVVRTLKPPSVATNLAVSPALRRATPPVVPARLAPDVPTLGVGLNCHHIGTLSLYLESVDAIAAMGANTLLVVTPMFMETASSSEIRFLEEKCPTNDQLIAILRRGRERGLATTLLPIVLIEHPDEKDWRGVIRPLDRDLWWASYHAFVDRFLKIAVTADVTTLSVGSELNSMEPDISSWTVLIDHVRARFDGRVTYTANWDRYTKVRFWDLVDHISVSSYFELAPEEPDAPRETLARSWGRIRDTLVAFARRQDRPLLLMELGYPTLPWAAAHPWNYVPDDADVATHEPQVRCFHAFFDAWTDTVGDPSSRILGFNCYAWDPYHNGEPYDTGYGIRGKPAFDVVVDGFTRIRAASNTAD